MMFGPARESAPRVASLYSLVRRELGRARIVLALSLAGTAAALWTTVLLFVWEHRLHGPAFERASGRTELLVSLARDGTPIGTTQPATTGAPSTAPVAIAGSATRHPPPTRSMHRRMSRGSTTWRVFDPATPGSAFSTVVALRHRRRLSRVARLRRRPGHPAMHEAIAGGLTTQNEEIVAMNWLNARRAANPDAAEYLDKSRTPLTLREYWDRLEKLKEAPEDSINVRHAWLPTLKAYAGKRAMWLSTDTNVLDRERCARSLSREFGAEPHPRAQGWWAENIQRGSEAYPTLGAWVSALKEDPEVQAAQVKAWRGQRIHALLDRRRADAAEPVAGPRPGPAATAGETGSTGSAAENGVRGQPRPSPLERLRYILHSVLYFFPYMQVTSRLTIPRRSRPSARTPRLEPTSYDKLQRCLHAAWRHPQSRRGVDQREWRHCREPAEVGGGTFFPLWRCLAAWRAALLESLALSLSLSLSLSLYIYLFLRVRRCVD